MNNSLRARLTQRTAIAAALATAAVLSGGGYALASSNSTGHTAKPGNGSAALSATAPRLKYLVGGNVTVPAHSAGSNTTTCPTGMYPVGGGPSSPSAVWQIQWSDPDRSTPTAAHPNEWAVGLFNTSGSPAIFKVFVVCATASSVSGNY
jgi:hypothetical protein